jgi:hypothetical protein
MYGKSLLTGHFYVLYLGQLKESDTKVVYYRELSGIFCKIFNVWEKY